MAINNVLLQPGAGSIVPAYRPIVFHAEAYRTSESDTVPPPPVVFCDIYIKPPGTDYNYFKSLSKTQWRLGYDTKYFEFDIQDACQEALSTVLGSYGGNRLVDLKDRYIKECSVKLRSSDLNGDGFLEPEGPAPVQATNDTGPIGGGGTSSNTFYVINASLQHVQNQILTDHLNAYKTGSWNAAFLPLTHRPSGYILTAADNDYFPLLMPAARVVNTIEVRYRFINQAAFWTKEAVISYPGFDDDNNPIMLDHFETFDDPTALYLPAGPANLGSMFPDLNFSDVAEYTVRLKSDADGIVAETPQIIVSKIPEYTRVYFQNYLGTIDALNFVETAIEHESKGETLQRAVAFPFDRSAHATQRTAVRSNDNYLVMTADYGEEAQAWLDELMDSALAWMDWPVYEAQAAGYVPIVVTDRKGQKRKVDDRFTYEVTLEFKLSHERINLRN